MHSQVYLLEQAVKYSNNTLIKLQEERRHTYSILVQYTEWYEKATDIPHPATCQPGSTYRLLAYGRRAWYNSQPCIAEIAPS